ncbi:APC family permease [Sinosporangium siamense]|uniref:Amino acid permease n=1 Tax=Sinosporangium siamense TaxID=1367973 RepID=A0A919RDT5_9ACTN|nr:APC family permease [Sinosporangium siamense]GII92061.1 amino acid permease [Sinosporangium siamense]
MATPTSDVPGGNLRREFTFASTFSLAFAFISPIIALYAIYALGLRTAGPPFWWAFLAVFAGQLLVATVLAELASRWPVEGGLLQWSHRLVGPRYGWATGWVYIWTLTTLAVATAYACSAFAARLLGLGEPPVAVRLALALAVVALSTLPNLVGPRALKVFVLVALACEAIGSLVLGTVLLVFHRANDLSVLFGGSAGDFSAGAFVGAVAIVGWAFIGFESAADVAEEVREPERAVPKALVRSLVLVALTVMYAGLALILATPDLGAVTAGGVPDPISHTVAATLGPAAVPVVMLVVCTGFIAGMAAIGAAVSRVVYALARDRELPFSRGLGVLSAAQAIPRNAVLACSALAAALLVLTVSAGLYDTLIAMSTGGFYLAFALPVLALLAHRRRGGWHGGPWRLPSVLSATVNVLAGLWLVAELVNIVWPRDTGAPWYVQWGSPLMFGAVAVLGVVTHRARRWERLNGRAPL